MSSLAWLYEGGAAACALLVMAGTVCSVLAVLALDFARSWEFSKYDKEDPPMK